MFNNIGSKIKTVAKVIACINIVISTVASVIMLANGLVNFDEQWILVFIAPLVFIVGFVMAWLSVILLYGFGELIDATCNNEKNTRNILNILQQNENGKEFAFAQPVKECAAKEAVVNNTVTPKFNYNKAPETVIQVAHKWRCDGCGKMRTQSPCEFCGNE